VNGALPWDAHPLTITDISRAAVDLHMTTVVSY